MDKELKDFLDALEKSLNDSIAKIDSKQSELEKKSLTDDEKKTLTGDLKNLQAEFKKLQDSYDETIIKGDPTGTAAKGIEARKAFNKEFKAMIVSSVNGATHEFNQKSVQTTEVAELGGIITKNEKDPNVIEFPQASLQFVNDLAVETISGQSITFVLEDPSFDSNFDELSSDDIDAFWTGENEEVANNSGEKFEEVKIPVHKMSVLITFTNEMIEDAEFDIVAYVQRKIEERSSFKQLVGFTVGTGVKSPTGFLDSDRVNVVQGKVDVDNIWIAAINLEHAISEMYREGGKYYMNDKVWAEIKKFRDADGRPLLVRGMNIIDATANTLNGKPVVTNCAMTIDTTTVGKRPIAFANMQRGYTKVMRKAMSFLVDKLTRKGFTKLYAEGRVGGDVTSKNAIALLEVEA